MLRALCIVLAFLLPPSAASGYFEVARVGAAVFLLIQLVILLGSVYEINDRWLGKATGYNEGGGKVGAWASPLPWSVNPV